MQTESGLSSGFDKRGPTEVVYPATANDCPEEEPPAYFEREDAYTIWAPLRPPKTNALADMSSWKSICLAICPGCSSLPNFVTSALL